MLLEIINGMMLLDINIQKTVKDLKFQSKLTGTLKLRGGTEGIRRRCGLSIVRPSRSFRCAVIRARRGVFGGVLSSLKNNKLKIKPKKQRNKKFTYIGPKLICCRAKELKLNAVQEPNQSKIQ